MELERLGDKFKPSDVEWRIQSSGKTSRGPWGKVLAYIDNRAIMDRLDSVCGQGAWRNNFQDFNGGIICNLSVNIPEIGWITKSDGCDASDVEPFKGAISGAMKRAAYQWGIGRYLYDLPVGFCNVIEEAEAKRRRNNNLFCGYNNSQDKRTKEWITFYWTPPNLPDWAVPEEYRGKDHYSLDSSLKEESERQASASRTSADLPDAPEEALSVASKAMQAMIPIEDPEKLFAVMERVRVRHSEGTITDSQLKELGDFYETKKAVLAGSPGEGVG